MGNLSNNKQPQINLMIDYLVAEKYTPEVSLLENAQKDGLLNYDDLIHKAMLTNVGDKCNHGCNWYMKIQCLCNELARLDVLYCEQHYHLVRFIGVSKENKLSMISLKIAMHKPTRSSIGFQLAPKRLKDVVIIGTYLHHFAKKNAETKIIPKLTIGDTW